MKIGILGTGMVGKTLGSKLVSLGHEVKMGSREAGNPEGTAWARTAGKGASEGTFADAASFGEMVFVCLRGDIALPVVKALIKAPGAGRMKGRIIVDVSNPLDVSKPMPVPDQRAEQHHLARRGNAESAAGIAGGESPEYRQLRSHGESSLVNGDSDLFICGNDAGAKLQVVEMLRSFGWKDPIDLGDISNARGTEALMPIWMRLWGLFGTPHFNYTMVK